MRVLTTIAGMPNCLHIRYYRCDECGFESKHPDVKTLIEKGWRSSPPALPFEDAWHHYCRRCWKKL